MVGRGTRWTAAYSDVSVPVPDDGGASRDLALDLPAGVTALSVDSWFQIDHPVLDTVEVVLETAAGSIPLAAVGTITGSTSWVQHDSLPSTTAAPTMSFTVNDRTADGQAGALTVAAVTVLTRGGAAPFPAHYRYTSAPKDLGAVAAFDEMSWAVRQAPPTVATMKVRTCDEVATCPAEPWVDVPLGSAPNVPPRRFLQYRVEVATDGDVPAALDWVDLSYFGAAG